MPTTGTKRFRTLASRLWACESDCEDLCDSANMPCSRITVAHHLETDGLERKILPLERQRLALEKTVEELRDKLNQVTLQFFEYRQLVIPLGGQPGLRTQPWTSNRWVEDNKHLLELPRMSECITQLDESDCGDEILFCLCDQETCTASRILKHCEWVICNLFRKHPAVYKIGITENPVNRWKGRSYSYKFDPTDDWQQMVVVFVGSDSLQCAFVEAHLIHRFLGRSGCRNVRPGGETAKPGPGPFFTYVVWKSLAPPSK